MRSFFHPTSISNPQILSCFKNICSLTNIPTYGRYFRFESKRMLKFKAIIQLQYWMYLCLVVIWCCYSLRKELLLDRLQIRLKTLNRSYGPSSHIRLFFLAFLEQLHCFKSFIYIKTTIFCFGYLLLQSEYHFMVCSTRVSS